MILFNVGGIRKTERIEEAFSDEELAGLLKRHMLGDFGDMCEEDRMTNLESIKIGRYVMSSYDTDKGTVWIQTNGSRTETVIMFPDEY